MSVPSNIVLVVLLLLLAATLGAWRVKNTHRLNAERRRLAAARGWRFAPVGAKAWLTRTFTLAGRTGDGRVWEVRRALHKGHIFLEWVSEDGTVPYGELTIRPHKAMAAPAGRPAPVLRPLAMRAERWPADLAVLTSHERLGQRYVTTAVVAALQGWPEWPQNGSLEEVRGTPEGWVVLMRVDEEWEGVVRLVELGAAVINN